jgi:uncharacterized protein (DUF58 family)
VEASQRTRRTRPTRRLFGTLLMAVAIYAVGANVAAGWVIAVGATMGALALHSAIGHFRAVRRLGVTVHPPQRTDEGQQDVRVVVDVPRRVVGTVRIGTDEDLPAAVIPEGTGRHALDVPARLERGTSQQLAVTVTLSDPLGLVVSQLTVDSPKTTVRPMPSGGRRTTRDTLEPTPAAEDDHHDLRGSTPDTELRPWRAGEPVRLVHWPTSLRTGQLQARHTVDETRPRVTLGIPDGVWDRDDLDTRCRAIRAEAERLTELGMEVELTADGVEVPWGPEALDLLASLPPHAAAEPRPLGGLHRAEAARW